MSESSDDSKRQDSTTETEQEAVSTETTDTVDEEPGSLKPILPGPKPAERRLVIHHDDEDREDDE